MELKSPENIDREELSNALINSLNHIRNHLGEQVTLSRYDNRSVTGLIDLQEDGDEARALLKSLFQYLEKSISTYGISVYMGAIISPNYIIDSNIITREARKALQHSINSDEKLTVYSKDYKKQQEDDYLSNAVIGSFKSLVNTSS